MLKEQQMSAKTAVVVATVMVALTLQAAPWATAGPGPLPGEYVRTQSGRVRCFVAPSQVICETHCAMGPNDAACAVPPALDPAVNGFPQAPLDNAGHHDNGVAVNAEGAFSWSEGDIGGRSPDVILGYGQASHMQGWTILPNFDGTRFTNDGTGHGMFVSIENVYSF